jgi:ribosomal protein S18 acetylase RimI-like enzyme
MPIRLNHVNLPARDPQKLAGWYGERLGFEVEDGHARGPGTLLVFEPGEPQPPSGNTHFGFEADSRAEVLRLAGELGCGPVIEPYYVGFKCTDPEGNCFEVYWERPAIRLPSVRLIGPEDADWLRVAARSLGGVEVVGRRTVLSLLEIPGFVAVRDGERVGFACYRTVGGDCQLVAIRATRRGAGVGSALFAAVEEVAAAGGAERIWVVTSNDNTQALTFYQRLGFRIVACRPGEFDTIRGRHASLPRFGTHGIPIRDEIELEKRLG